MLSTGGSANQLTHARALVQTVRAVPGSAYADIAIQTSKTAR